MASEIEQLEKKNLIPIKKIAEGTFASILVVKDQETEQVYSFKSHNPLHHSIHIYHEHMIYEQLKDHPNLLKCYGFINKYDPTRMLGILFEHCEAVDLFYVISYHQDPKNEMTLQEGVVHHLISELVSVIEYAHSRDVYHMDIKPENILITQEGRLKLIDWGLATHLSKQETSRRCAGSLCYASPELLLQKSYLPMYADLWSLGVLSYCLFESYFPFFGNSGEDILSAIVSGRYTWPSESLTSQPSRDFVNSLLQMNPEDRFIQHSLLDPDHCQATNLFRRHFNDYIQCSGQYN